MHLDDWIKLSPEERQAYRHLWDSNPREKVQHLELFDELNFRLMSEFGQHPNVMEILADSNDIYVATDLPTGQLIPNLPAEYLSFSVTQEQIGEEIQAYKDVWTAQLSRLFNWREEAIAEFIHRSEYVWRSVCFRLDPPQRFLPWYQIFTETYQEIRHAQENPRSCGDDLEAAVGNNSLYYEFLKPDFDWPATKSRVDEVVKKYGLTYSTLPQKSNGINPIS